MIKIKAIKQLCFKTFGSNILNVLRLPRIRKLRNQLNDWFAIKYRRRQIKIRCIPFQTNFLRKCFSGSKLVSYRSWRFIIQIGKEFCRYNLNYHMPSHYQAIDIQHLYLEKQKIWSQKNKLLPE
jgi:hypothetical protein